MKLCFLPKNEIHKNFHLPLPYFTQSLCLLSTPTHYMIYLVASKSLSAAVLNAIPKAEVAWGLSGRVLDLGSKGC